jgi:hypothetical protein
MRMVGKKQSSRREAEAGTGERSRQEGKATALKRAVKALVLAPPLPPELFCISRFGSQAFPSL